MNNFRKLTVWKLAILLAKSVFLLVKKLPNEEKFSTIDQLKRCVISISSNIAEGSGRSSVKEFNYFLSIAYGSSCELDSLLQVCYEVEYITEEELKTLSNDIVDIQKMLKSLQRTVSKKP